MRIRTPVMLITGSRGSGKTTLLRRIIEVTRQRIAVAVRGFGQMAVNGRSIAGAHVQIVELAGGCICCSITGDFELAVREIIDFSGPEFIVVEASGVSEVDAFVLQVEENLPEVRIDSFVHIVDACPPDRHPHVSPISGAQLKWADIVLINKIDLVTTQELREMEALVRLHNDRAVLVKTMGCDVDLNLLFGMSLGIEGTSTVPRSSVHLQTFSYTTDAFLDEARFVDFIGAIGAAVFRARGSVRFPGATCLLNYVLGRVDLEEYESDVTELVFTGFHLDERREAIEGGLRNCEIPHALRISG